MADYVYNLGKASDMKKLYNFYDNYAKEITSDNFKKFIAEKCIKQLEKIMSKHLHSLPEYHVSSDMLQRYKDSNSYEIHTDKIVIFNDAMLEPGEMTWVSEKTMQRYPEGISIASIIEYGTGLRGKDGEDWIVRLESPSKDKDGKWTFKKNGTTYKKVSGLEGRFIYDKLLKSVDKYFEIWFEEYFERVK